MIRYCISCYANNIDGGSNKAFVIASFTVAGTALCGTCAKAAYDNLIPQATLDALKAVPGRAPNRERKT